MPQVFHFYRIPGTDSILSILPQYIIKYHHDTFFLFLPYSRNRFKVAINNAFNNLHRSSVIVTMAKHFKYFTSLQESSHHYTVFLFLSYSRNRFKVAMRPYDVREVVESFGAGQVKDCKYI